MYTNMLVKGFNNSLEIPTRKGTRMLDKIEKMKTRYHNGHKNGFFFFGKYVNSLFKSKWITWTKVLRPGSFGLFGDLE